MWKAFPNNKEMTYAFYEMSKRQQKQKITAKVYEVLKLEFSKVQSRHNLKRVADGTHHWLDGKIQSETAKKRVLKQLKDGTHPFLGGEVQRKNSLKRVANGTHPFLGGEIQRKRVINGTHNFLGGNLQREKVANGTHNFLSGKIQRKNAKERLENGTHPSQIKKTCPHCGKEIDIGNYKRWHGDRCKSLFEE